MSELPEIELFPRADGYFGVRNHVAVIATVVCANAVVERLDRDELNLALITHQHGCAQVGDDLSLTRNVLAGVACNPNVGAALLVSLGCESNVPQTIAEQVAATGRPCEIFGIQEYGGVSATYEAVRRAAQRHAEDLARQPRERVAFRELVIGLECGGSDAWSGITANPALGRAADRLVDAGATVVLAETPEIIGGEHLLADRAIDPAVAERLLTAVWRTDAYCGEVGRPCRVLAKLLMTIDPLKQQAIVDQQQSTEAQKKAILDYNQIDLERQNKLYQAAVASKQAYDQALQAYENSKADWEASTSATVTQERELSYYSLTAPFDGVVGDIPVHVGDYVSPTLLTTVDENDELEAYIYMPTERAADIHMGLPVQIVSNAGELIESTKIYFISPQVDNAPQGILVKAPIHASLDKFRTSQLVKARVMWSTAPTATVPVLALLALVGNRLCTWRRAETATLPNSARSRLETPLEMTTP